MDRLRGEVEKVHFSLKMLQMAELQAAHKLLGTAGHTDCPGRCANLLQAAKKTFQKYRHYYYCWMTLT